MSIRIGRQARVTLNRNMRWSIFSEYSMGYTGLRTFYISDTDGDDTRTVTQAQNPNTPWKTMAKVESFGNGSLGSYPNKAAAGDVFKFKKGDTFYCSNRSFGGFRWWGGSYGTAASGTSTNPIVFTSYGSGDKPNFLFPDSATVLEAWNKVIFHLEGISYVIFDGLQFNDPRPPVPSPQNPYTQYKVGGAATGQAIFLGEPDSANNLWCNNNIVKNCYTNNIGYGISVCGDNNLFTNNTFENFGQMYPLTLASYGQVSVQITGNNNIVTYNIMKGGWAWADSFEWNGGAVELVDGSNNTTIMYNTIVDCNSVLEFGISNTSHVGETISGVLFAYNKVINCGEVSYFNPLITGSNVQIYNNVVIENSLSRFSGINFASGAQDFPTYQPSSCPKRPYPADVMISYSPSQDSYSGSILYNIKNNVFVLSNAPITITNDYNSSTGLCNITRTYTPSVVSTNLRTSYSNNVYKVSNGATIGHTLGGGESSTTTQLFADITSNNPELWNYYPSASSILINAGANVGLTTDFFGDPVVLPPNIGISEYIPPTPSGAAINVTFNANGLNFQNWFVQGSSNFSMTVFWGDGNVNTYSSADNYQPSHVYMVAGDYNATITFSDPTVITNLDISTGYGNNRLKSITGLDILSSSLSSLILGGNILTSFTSASGLTSNSVLNVLDLSYNTLSTFNTTLPDSLTDLYLNNNSLTSFNPTLPLPFGLINLYLNNNSITSFNPSYPLPYSLQTLNLSNNQLPNFIPTQILPSGLSTLDLSYNSITTFQPTGSFPNGNSNLYLNNNNMSSANISNALVYLSGSVANWVAPNNMVFWNQTVGGCITNPSTAYSAAQYLVGQGWTVDYDLC